MGGKKNSPHPNFRVIKIKNQIDLIACEMGDA